MSGDAMTVIHRAVRTRCGGRAAAAAVLAASLLSIQCARKPAPLAPIDRTSFPLCSRIGPHDDEVKYLATGLKGGTYVLLGDAIAKIARDNPRTRVEVCLTGGSSENLKLLAEGTVQFALVQLDTLHYAIEAAHSKDDGDEEDDSEHVSLEAVRFVTFLYSEKLHVFVRPHLYLNSPADFNRNGGRGRENGVTRRARVWLGPPRSGARQTASKVLQADGVPDEDIETIGTKLDDLNWNKASNCLLAKGDQGLVAYFRVMAVPKHSPSRPADEGRHPRSICPPFGAEAPPLSVDDLLEADAQLMPLPQALIDRLTEDKLYVPTTIDLGTYSELKRGVPTIGIPTVLLTSLPDDDGAAATVKALIGEIERGKGLIEDHIEDVELDQLDRHEPLHGIGTHEGAKKHLEARNPTVLWGGLFALGLLVAHARRNPGSFRRGLAARSYMLVLSGSLTGVWLMLSLAMMRAEGHLNPKFRTLGASFRHTFQIVARMSDDRLMTPEGEIWRWLGLLLFPIILGWLFSDVIKEAFRLSAVKLAHLIRSAQVRQAPSAVITTARCLQRIIRGLIGGSPASPGSLVFLNWNCRAEQIANALRNDDRLPSGPVVVVGPPGSGPQNGGAAGDVRFVEGDPASRAAMEKAGVLDANAVTIVSAWAPSDPLDRRRRVDPEYADAKTLLALLAIRALCEDGDRSRVLPITAEIRLARNHQEAKNAVQGGKLALTCVAV